MSLSNSNWGSSCNSLNRSSSCNWSINMVNWEVGRTNTETKSIGNVVDALHNTIRINIAVSSTDDTVSSLDLLLHRTSVVVPKAVLTSIVLGVVLASLGSSRRNLDRGSSVGHRCGCLDNRSSVHNRCWS